MTPGMRTLRSLALTQIIVMALAASSGAAPRARHVVEPPREVAVDDDDVLYIDEPDEPEVAPVRRRAIAPAERDPGWHLGVAVGADIPVDALNVGLVIEAPSGLRLSSSVGVLADVFLGPMAAPDNQAAAALVHAALRDAIVWRTHLGIKPWKTRGFYASAGYSLCSFGLTMSTEAAMSALADQMLTVGLGSTPLMHMTSTLHALDLEAGWEWPIARRFKFRTAISAAMMIASTTHLHIENSPLASLPLPSLDSLITSMERAGEATIDAAYKDAGPMVMLTVQLQLDLL
jgi:hypothetical protein